MLMLRMQHGSHGGSRRPNAVSSTTPRDLPKGPLNGASHPCHRASPLRAQRRNLARPNMDPHVSRPTGSPGTEADLAIAAKKLISQVLAAREECEGLRRIPAGMVEALAQAGLL